MAAEDGLLGEGCVRMTKLMKIDEEEIIRNDSGAWVRQGRLKRASSWLLALESVTKRRKKHGDQPAESYAFPKHSIIAIAYEQLARDVR
jgi:hypothetical protein